MKNVAFKLNYIGEERITLFDIQNVLSNITNEGILQVDETVQTLKKVKNISFVISYLGDLPLKISEIKRALEKLNIDERGIIKITKINPLYKLCEYCNGTGNEGTMNFIDCGNCGGSGWIKEK